jgi:type IX secretion system PorP/SprF family membrane protein
MLILICHGKAQDRVSKYPVRMCQYYDSYIILNPALAGSIANYELSTGYQRLMGNFNKVSTYYLNANIRLFLRQKNGGPYSVIGIRFFNDKEGKYLNRTRGYINYSWHANLTRKVKFSAGLEIGGMNYSVKGTPLSGDGSDIKPDASAGIGIYNSSFHVGISMSQLFKSEVQPLEEVTVLYPFINLTAERKFKILEDAVIIPSTSIRILTNDRKIMTDFNLGVLIKKRIFFSPGIHNNNKLVVGVGINDLMMMKGNMNIHLSYGFPVARGTLNYSFGEIGVLFLL